MYSINRLFRVAACVCSLGFAARPAVSDHWINPAGGLFQDPSNWENGVVPGHAEHSLGTAGYTVTSNAPVGLQSLTVNNDTVRYDLDGSTLNTVGLDVGSGGGDSHLTLLDGVYDAVQPQIGIDAGVGVVNVSGPGSILDNVNPGASAATAHAIAVGLEGAGELNITNGGLVRTQFLGAAGGFTGLTGIGSATINVDNASLIHESAFDDPASTIVDLGDGGGNATMNLTNDAVFSTDYLVIAGGTIAGNTATINVMSGSDWTSSQWRLGEDFGNSATMNVDGTGSTMLADFGCFIGYQGSGEFNVTNGATARFIPDGATAGTGFLGLGRLGAGSSGTMTIDGAGSMVSVEGAVGSVISIGRDGVGNATVSNGGLLTTVPGGDITIGRTATAIGTLTVIGAGAIARGHNGINVGGTATSAGNSGTLHVTNGGSIETTNLVVYAGDTVNVNTGGFGTIGTIGTVVNTANTLTVRIGGTLRGVGTVNGNVTVATGGTLSPGLSPGLLTVNGTLNLGNCISNAGGTYNMEITAPGVAGTNYDSMVVTGSVLLGGTLNLIVSGTYVPNGAHQFNVITGSSNIVGAVQSITNRVINPALIGGTVWGDYIEDNSGVGTDRYYITPRRKGDFDGSGGVNGGDYTLWSDHFGQTWSTFGEGDANGDRQVTGADYTIWADNFSQTSFDSDGVALSTYGCAVDAAAFDVEVTPDPEFDVALNGIRTMQRVSGAGIPDVAGGSVSSVPEPSSFVLGAMALIGWAVYGLRRHSA